MHYCRRDSHTTSRTAIYANITQTGRIWVYCSWFWVVLVGFVGFVGGSGWFCWWFWVVLGRFGWFWVVLGRFGWFRVLVTTRQKFIIITKCVNLLIKSATTCYLKCDNCYYKVRQLVFLYKVRQNTTVNLAKPQCIRHWSNPRKEGVYLQFEPFTIHFADTEYS